METNGRFSTNGRGATEEAPKPWSPSPAQSYKERMRMREEARQERAFERKKKLLKLKKKKKGPGLAMRTSKGAILGVHGALKVKGSTRGLVPRVSSKPFDLSGIATVPSVSRELVEIKVRGLR